VDPVSDPPAALGARALSAPLDWQSTNPELRFRRLFPFVVLCVIALPGAYLLPGGVDSPLLAAASVCMLAAAALTIGLPWHRIDLGYSHVLVGLFCLGVALLRHAAGASTAGYGAVLILIPVIWQSLYGRRIGLAIVLLAVPTSLLLPIAFVDGYPANVELPRTALLTLLSCALGLALRDLADTIRDNDEAVNGLIKASADLHAVADPRPALCQAVRTLLGADDATLFERAADGFRPTSSTPGAGPVALGPGARLRSGELAFVGERDQRLLQVPVGDTGVPAAVIVARWGEPGPPPNRAVLRGVMLLASHAALALERADLVAALDAQANRDGLTGLANRRAWDAALEAAIVEARQSGQPLSIAILDLDRFKAFNDKHGHLAGDDLLRAVAQEWRAGLRGDLLARWGGEEFAVLLQGSTATQATAALSRLRSVTPLGQTFSAGISQLRDDDTAGSLMAAADQAMYEAKTTGRDRFVRADRPDPS
jgi:diguanylate cyclase (GGDEF)-like protein